MEIKNLKEFNEFVDSCRKKGLKSVKLGDISIELAEAALFPKTPYQLKKEEIETKKSLEAVSQNALLEAEKALFWSSEIVTGAEQ